MSPSWSAGSPTPQRGIVCSSERTRTVSPWWEPCARPARRHGERRDERAEDGSRGTVTEAARGQAAPPAVHGETGLQGHTGLPLLSKNRATRRGTRSQSDGRQTGISSLDFVVKRIDSSSGRGRIGRFAVDAESTRGGLVRTGPSSQGGFHSVLLSTDRALAAGLVASRPFPASSRYRVKEPGLSSKQPWRISAARARSLCDSDEFPDRADVITPRGSRRAHAGPGRPPWGT